MCIGIPQKVLKTDGTRALVSAGDHEHWLDVAALGEAVVVGDYLLSYQGAAINKISAEEAEKVLQLVHFSP
jgi:hydrogenase assembly chaperone HypC/HupF